MENMHTDVMELRVNLPYKVKANSCRRLMRWFTAGFTAVIYSLLMIIKYQLG